MRHWLCGIVASCIVCCWGLDVRAADANAEAGNRDGDAGPLPALPSAAPVSYDAPPLPPPLPPPRRVKWGAQFRLEGAPMGSNAASNAGMGGFGMSFRPRPSPSFAVDIGVDFIGGRDFNGERRGEQSLTINPMIFVMPRRAVSLYFFGGLGLASARVEHVTRPMSRYSYIGVDGGGGVELHFWRRVALDADVLFFVRDHTDDEVARYPEFIELGTGRYTNASKGAVIRVGVAYYW
jgi:hypothetical protein